MNCYEVIISVLLRSMTSALDEYNTFSARMITCELLRTANYIGGKCVSVKGH